MAKDRLSSQSFVELARYRDLAKYVPKMGDFVIWHGWFSRWYGVISEINGDILTIIHENLPKLLFTMPEMDREKHKKMISLISIRTSRGGEFHILQDGTWFLDD